MNLNDYVDPADPSAPRPKASQLAGGKRRTTEPETVRRAVPLGMVSYQLSSSPVRPLQIRLTDVPERHTSLFVAPSRTPVLAPTSRVAPSVAPEPPGDVQGASEEVPPQTGRGLTVSEAVATPEPPPAAPSYIENVGAQAEHCIRSCDGQRGQVGGDWVAVPPISAEQAAIIGAQAPHKVR